MATSTNSCTPDAMSAGSNLGQREAGWIFCGPDSKHDAMASGSAPNTYEETQTMRMRFSNKVALFCAAAMLCAGTACAQSTTQGAIAGTVEDASGAVVPNATVTIHNEGTNAEHQL